MKTDQHRDRQESPETNRMRKTYSDTGAESRDPDPVLRRREAGPEAAGKPGGGAYGGPGKLEGEATQLCTHLPTPQVAAGLSLEDEDVVGVEGGGPG